MSRSNPKDGKPEEQKAKSRKSKAQSLESKVESPKPEKENNSAPDGYRDNVPHSEIKELTTDNSQLQTDTMEVHHHPEVEKKGFKEYLLEGLMIFLAVLMGFVAENFRESISEHSRAKEFAVSYYDDLKKDSVAVQAAVRYSKNKISALDSGLANLHLPKKQQNDTALYREFTVASVVAPFDPSEGTYEQIKSSGSLRYFKQKMASLMNDYDVQVKKTVKREDIDLKFIVEQYFPFFIKNFNTEVIYDDRYLHHISHELYINWDMENIRQMVNYIVVIKLERFRAMEAYKKQITVLNTVLAELRKEYSLE